MSKILAEGPDCVLIILIPIHEFKGGALVQEFKLEGFRAGEVASLPGRPASAEIASPS